MSDSGFLSVLVSGDVSSTVIILSIEDRLRCVEASSSEDLTCSWESWPACHMCVHVDEMSVVAVHLSPCSVC